MKAPASVLAASLLFAVSAIYCFFTGSLGAEFFEFGEHFTLPFWAAAVVGIVHLYAAIWLLLGDNFARCLALWLLGLGFLVGWFALWNLVQGGGTFQEYAQTVVKILLCTWFLWHLSGPNAIAHTGGEHGHDEGHAHA